MCIMYAFRFISHPWPSCFRRPFVQRQSYQGGKAVRMDQLLRCPLFQAQDPRGRSGERTDHRWPHYRKHLFSRAAGRSLPCTHPSTKIVKRHRMNQLRLLGQFRAHQSKPPKISSRSGCRIGRLEYVRFHASLGCKENFDLSQIWCLFQGKLFKILFPCVHLR